MMHSNLTHLKTSYFQDGYAFPIDAFSSEEASQYLNRLEAIEAEFGAQHELDKYFRYIAHATMPLANELVRHPKILDIVTSVMGPDLIAWSSEFFIKEPHTENFVSWHQDLRYWGLGSTDHEITAWVALTPVTRENGCMRFIPGSHHNEILEHEDTFDEDNILSRGQVLKANIDDNDAVDVTLNPGQLSLHHGRMFHSSGPNRSDQRRVGFVVRYLTPSVKPQVTERDYAMLVSGKDKYGHFDTIVEPTTSFGVAELQQFDQIYNHQKTYYFQDA